MNASSEFKRQRESACASLVVEALRREGRDIHDLWYPDQVERNAPAPDAAFVMDEVVTALEITTFFVEQRERAESVMSRIVQILRDRLVPLAEERQLGDVRLSIMHSELLPTKRRMGPAIAAIEAAIRKAMMAAPSPTTAYRTLPIPVDVDGVRSVRLSFSPSETGSVGWMSSLGGMYPGGAVRDFVRDQLVEKSVQVAAYPRAILAVIRTFWVDAEDLDMALVTTPVPAPWWRVYLVDLSAQRVHLGQPWTAPDDRPEALRG